MNKIEYVLILVACFLASVVGLLMEFAGLALAFADQGDLALTNAVLGIMVFAGGLAVAMLTTIVYSNAAKAVTR